MRWQRGGGPLDRMAATPSTIRIRHGMAAALVPALLGLVAGTAAQLQQAALFGVPAYGTSLVLGLGAAAVLQRLRGWMPLPWSWIAHVLAFAVLAFGLTGWRAVVFQSQALAPRLEGRDLLIQGVVQAMPQRTDAGLRFRFRVERATDRGQPVRLPPLVLLGWYGGAGREADEAELLGGADLPVLWAGERWQMAVRLKAPHGSSNPSGFDYELWMWEQGLQANGYVRLSARDPPPRRLGQTGHHPVELARQHVRTRITARLGEGGQAGWITALVTGDQNAIERADWNVFRATGVAHLMAISGLHVTMFAWLAATLVGAAWRRSTALSLRFAAPHAALIGGLLLAWAYALFSGWGVPAQRTIWMLCAIGLLRLSGRVWPWPVVWLLAGGVVLLVDPWAWLQAGFWLSFVAVGVLFASGGTVGEVGSGRLRRRIWSMVREQWVISLALTPLVLLLFGQVSTVGLLANLLAIPWVTLVVTPLALAGVVLAPLWDLAAGAVALLNWYLQWLAAWPFAVLALAVAPAWIGLAGVAGGLLLVARLPLSLRLAAPALLLPSLLWQAPRPAMGQFGLLVADVGQGTAVLVQTTNHALLYDAGPRYSRDSDAGDRVLVPLLRTFAVRLDRLVLSHRDSDHVGGAPAVLGMHARADVWSSIEPEHPLHDLRPVTRCAAGQRWTWDGVVFTVLHPRASDYAAAAKPNAMSCVLRIEAAARGGSAPVAALLTGDIEAAQESRLVALADGALRADVLLVPHHGSKTSSSAEFLDAVAPQLALVQSGYRNRFGHPAAAPLARYRERRITLFDSPHCGAMVWRSTEPQALTCQRVQALRYWHHVAP